MTLAFSMDPDTLETLHPRHPSLPAPPAVVVDGLAKSLPVARGALAMLRHPGRSGLAPVLRQVSFSVSNGEMFGLLGLNGAGKTTLLRILATFLTPDRGVVEVLGRDVYSESRAVRDSVALVAAEERSLHWRLSADENLRLFAGLHRLSGGDAAVRIAEALEAVQLSDTGKKRVSAFSSGMRQRLLVARALLARPRVLLLDEPTRSLDPISAHDFRTMLRERLVAGQVSTVLIATHDAEEAFSYCDRVAVLHEGRVAALGRAQDLAARFALERYCIWLSDPDHPALAQVEREGLLRRVSDHPSVPGEQVTCAIAGGDAQAAAVLHRLVLAGANVHRFERQAASLGALIRAIAADSRARVHDHA